MFVKIQKQKAFTLIELLVVISVIGLVASVALVALSTARAKARDVKRVADINQLRRALELYYDANGTYPNYGQVSDSTSCDAVNPTFTTVLAPYIATTPHDPLFGTPATPAYCYFYNVKNSGQGYVIMAYHVEQTSTANSGDGTACYPSFVGYVYCKGVNYQ